MFLFLKREYNPTISIIVKGSFTKLGVKKAIIVWITALKKEFVLAATNPRYTNLKKSEYKNINKAFNPNMGIKINNAWLSWLLTTLINFLRLSLLIISKT